MTAVSKTTVKDYLKAAAYYLLAIAAAFGVAGLILLTMHQDVLLGYKTILTTSFSSLPKLCPHNIQIHSNILNGSWILHTLSI
jgi:ABC-type uncharacterized transport system permease subunit